MSTEDEDRVSEHPEDVAGPAEEALSGSGDTAVEGRRRRAGLVESPGARWTAAAAAVIVVGGLLFMAGRWSAPDGASSAAAPTAVTTTLPVADAGSTVLTTTGAVAEPVAEVAETLAPAVVQIESGTGLGSGVIYRRDGYILTAAHVVSDSDTVSVRLADGNRLDGRVVGVNSDTDVAVIKVEAGGLTAAPLATDADLRLGQMAIAIGSPWGLDQTVTAGVVSSVRRAVVGSDGNVRTLIQTDASINPGNSGGALADATGAVIGINTSIITTTGSSGGVGFAIPIDTAVSVADRLISGEEIRSAFLGVAGTEPTTGPAGTLVTGVTRGSAAAEAGLLRGDLITAYDDLPVTGFLDLAGYVRSAQPGDEVTLTVIRADEQQTITVVLGERTD
ncbi:MAG: trypsin-like peptidase domain-containing protein [Actinobacteria bacterium]|nr:trypsin-like peptidase domain-containing protein [Actinomycetota bacterium]